MFLLRFVALIGDEIQTFVFLLFILLCVLLMARRNLFFCFGKYALDQKVDLIRLLVSLLFFQFKKNLVLDIVCGFAEFEIRLDCNLRI